MFAQEIKRAVCSGGMLLGAVGYFGVMLFIAWFDYAHANEVMDAYYFFNLANSRAVSYAVVVIALLAVLPYALSFAREWDSRYVRSAWLRTSLPRYCATKSLASFASGALCLALGAALCFVFFGAQFPLMRPESVSHEVSQRFMDADIAALRWGPALHVTMRVLSIAVYGGFCSMLALAVSAYVADAKVAMCVPFIGLEVLGYLIDRFKLPFYLRVRQGAIEGFLNYQPESWGYLNAFGYTMSLLLILSGICAALFYFGARRRMNRV